MSVKIAIPDELYREASAIAETLHIPVEEVFTSAFTEQLRQRSRILERAKRGSREKFEAVLAKVPDVEPDSQDKLP